MYPTHTHVHMRTITPFFMHILTNPHMQVGSIVNVYTDTYTRTQSYLMLTPHFHPFNPSFSISPPSPSQNALLAHVVLFLQSVDPMAIGEAAAVIHAALLAIIAALKVR